jgi:hypothetical protein
MVGKRGNMNEQPRTGEERRQRRQTRKALLLWLKRLRRAGRAWRTAEDWYEFMRRLEDWLQKEGNHLTAEERQGLQRAMHLRDASSQGLTTASQLLELQIEQVIAGLPAAGVAGPIVLGAFIAAALAIGGGVAYANATAVEVTIINQGCRPVRICQGVVPALDLLLGVVDGELPAHPIPAGAQGTMRLPAANLTLDGTQRGTIRVSVLGLPPAAIGCGDVSEMLLDGQSLLGRQSEIHLGDQKAHRLVLRCP